MIEIENTLIEDSKHLIYIISITSLIIYIFGRMISIR